MSKYRLKKDYSSNLIAKWVFDNTYSENGINAIQGNILNDLSGNNNNGTMYNLTFVDDIDLGRCGNFNRVDSYVRFNSPIIPVGKKSRAIEFKKESYSADSLVYTRILQNGSAGAGRYQMSIQ